MRPASAVAILAGDMGDSFIHRARAEVLRWLATSGPLALLFLLQSCSTAGAAGIPGLPDFGGGADPIDYDRLERAVADLQCTPAAVHAEVVAERDTWKRRALDQAATLTTREDQLADARAEAQAVTADYRALSAEHNATRALLTAIVGAEGIEAMLAAIQAARAAVDEGAGTAAP